MVGGVLCRHMTLTNLIPFKHGITRDTQLADVGLDPETVARLAKAGYTTVADIDERPTGNGFGRLTTIRGIDSKREREIELAIYRMLDADYDVPSSIDPAAGGNTSPGFSDNHPLEMNPANEPAVKGT